MSQGVGGRTTKLQILRTGNPGALAGFVGQGDCSPGAAVTASGEPRSVAGARGDSPPRSAPALLASLNPEESLAAGAGTLGLEGDAQPQHCLAEERGSAPEGGEGEGRKKGESTGVGRDGEREKGEERAPSGTVGLIKERKREAGAEGPRGAGGRARTPSPAGRGPACPD